MTKKEESTEVKTYIRRGIFDRKLRQLLITPEFIQFENKSGSNPFTIFNSQDICAYRYGINWISGYQFTIGREYVIFIRNSSDEVLKINFKSFYGVKKSEYHKLYLRILDTIWDFYFGRIGGKLLAQFNSGNDVTIGRATLTNQAVIINDGGVTKVDKKVISWEKLETKEYYTYIAVYSSEDAAKTHATFSFLNDWDTMVLFSVIRRVLRDKKIEIRT